MIKKGNKSQSSNYFAINQTNDKKNIPIGRILLIIVIIGAGIYIGMMISNQNKTNNTNAKHVEVSKPDSTDKKKGKSDKDEDKPKPEKPEKKEENKKKRGEPPKQEEKAKEEFDKQKLDLNKKRSYRKYLVDMTNNRFSYNSRERLKDKFISELCSDTARVFFYKDSTLVNAKGINEGLKKVITLHNYKKIEVKRNKVGKFSLIKLYK